VNTGRGLKWLVKKLTVLTGVAYRDILKNFF